MYRRSLLAVAATLIMLIPLVALRAESACYAMRLPADSSQLEELTLDTSKHSISVSERGLPIRFYFDFDWCSSDSGEKPHLVRCGYDCHSEGEFSYFVEKNGIILLDVDEELVGAGLSMKLDGQFRLKEADPKLCEAASFDFEKNRKTMRLKKGDFQYDVAKIEADLAKLGYFGETPDWFYTDTTQSAVKRFQTDAGREATGVADFETQRLLRRRSKVGSSGC